MIYSIGSFLKLRVDSLQLGMLYRTNLKRSCTYIESVMLMIYTKQSCTIPKYLMTRIKQLNLATMKLCKFCCCVCLSYGRYMVE